MPEPGAVATYAVVVEERHTAHAAGNPGVRVLSTPTLAHFCALAARRAVARGLAEDELAVPRRSTLAHLKASPPGARIEATARVTAVNGREVTLEVEARDGDGTAMTGTQLWAIEDRAALLAAADG
ncbi:MAG: hypothetical protein OXC28_25955 [Defluviicoccus sp.]|nr:hypothetical protein [Defluviicoccus sp.]